MQISLKVALFTVIASLNNCWIINTVPADEKSVVFIAGKKSHGYFSHEHKAGCLLLADALKQSGLPVKIQVITEGWPSDSKVLQNADTIVSYCDGGPRHFLNPHLQEFDELMKQGIGLVCIHYAVETVPGEPSDYFRKWIGGAFETFWSVNPHWLASFETLPDHPITNGVKPFAIKDEWYYHMRFVPEMKGVTPILSDLPPNESLSRKDGHHSNNPHVREAVMVRKEPQHVAWAFDRPDGGRGFGFTGGHNHQNWQQDDFRKVVLNAIWWTAGGEVPSNGVTSKTPTIDQLKTNQDYDPPKNWQFKPAETKEITQSKPDSVPVKTVSLKTEKPEGPSQSRALKDATIQLDVADGLEVTLFAGEPMLANPANMDIDAKGRVWVCEAINYRKFRNKESPEREEGDRILILEDTDGDGQADKQITYYQGRDVDSAHGVCVLGNSALISAGDSVFWLIDDDGDDKADRKLVLFTGIDGTQHDHGIHSFVFGPDGKLYFNFGNAGKQIKDKNGKPIIDKAGNEVNVSRQPYQEGMVFRCHLDGSEFETLGWNFRNNWELCVDSFGTIWQSDNDDDGNRGVRINYVMEYGNYGYKDEFTGDGWRAVRTGWHEEIPKRHWHLNDPGVVPNLLQTGAGSPTGILIYEGDLLPKVFQNQIIHCDAGPNIVRAYPVESVGAGYSAIIENLLDGLKRDQWFRPSDVCTAPDGSIFIADWYDPGVGGHRMGDSERGRIFRIAPPNAPYKIQPVDASSPDGAVAALSNPNLATRFLGWLSLMKANEESVPALKVMWKSENPRLRARALWALGKLKMDRNEKLKLLSIALVDQDPNIRITAIRLCRQLFHEFELEDVQDAMDLHDSSPAVRRELLIGLRELDIPEKPDYWAILASQHQAGDRWYLEALGIAAEGHWDACLNAWLKQVGDEWNSPAGQEIIWRSRSSQTPKLLADLIMNFTDNTSQMAHFVRSLDFQSGNFTEVLEHLALTETNSSSDLERFRKSEALIRLMKISPQNQGKYQDAVNALVEQFRGTPTYVDFVTRFKLQDRYPDLIQLAIDHFNEQLGVDAIRGLILQRQWPLISESLRKRDIQEAVKLIEVMSLASDNGTAGVFQGILQNKKMPLKLRRAAVKGMMSSGKGINDMIAYVNAGKYDSNLVPTIAAAMHASTRADARQLASKKFPLPPSKDATPLPPIPVLASRKGDINKGRLVYNTNGTCAKCHIVNGMGKEVGPDLSEIGKKLSRTAMYEAILYPSAGISHNYESYSVLTIDGNVFTGLMVSQNDAEVVIKDAQGIIRKVPQDDVEELFMQKISLMPADLQKVMSGQELVDLVEYLTTLKVKKK